MLEALGQYKILGLIGIGRMGELYRARDTRAGRTVAIRVLADDIARDPVRRGRYLKDARAATTLSHPNIAVMYEFGSDQGHLFMVSEYVPGDTLKAVIAGRPLNPRHAIDHGIQLADALAEAHAADVVHGDIRPDNIVITPKGNAKFLDFGLGAWTGSGTGRREAPAALATDTATAPDAVAYMSPEQVLGEQADYRTDIFSLGAVVFEMLTGAPPFSAASASALAMQIVQTRPTAPSALNPALPAELDAIVLRMLAKSLDQRCESAASIAAELRSIAAMLDVRDDAAEPAGAVIDSARRSRGAGLWIMLAVLAAFVLAAALMTTDLGQRWWSTLVRAWQQNFGLVLRPW
jgi:eukaryotic-like serine/threonine-protein kinase